MRSGGSGYVLYYHVCGKATQRYKSQEPSTNKLLDILARFKHSRDSEEVMTNRELLSPRREQCVTIIYITSDKALPNKTKDCRI
jgi:hypothetical protein